MPPHPSETPSPLRHVLPAWVPWLIAFGGLATTLLIYARSQQTEHRNLERQLQLDVDDAHRFARQQLERGLATLGPLAARFASDRLPGRTEFEETAEQILRQIPEIVLFEWQPVVLAGDRDGFEATLQRDHPGALLWEPGPGGEPRPATPRDWHLPVHYAVTRLGDPGLGLDLAWSPTRLESKLVAVERASPTASSAFVFVQDAVERLGIVVSQPVFRSGSTPPAGPDRRAALVGFLAAGFHLEPLFAQAWGPATQKGLAVAVYDTDDLQRLLHQNSRSPHSVRALELHHERDLPWAGRAWNVHYFPTAEWLTLHYTHFANWVLGVGLVVTGLLVFGFAATRRHHRALAESHTRLAHESTERRRAEEALALAHQRLESHLDNTPLAVVEWGSDFRCIRWSRRAEQIFGWSAAEILGREFGSWPWVHTDDLERVSAVASRLLSGQERAQVNRNRNYTKDGRTLHIDWYNSALHDERGRLVSILTFAHDVTELHEGEVSRRRLEAKMQEVQRLESLGVLAGGVAHDFNNLLTGILGNASIARQLLTAPGEVGECLHEIEKAAQRAADLCRQMLAYSGRGRFFLSAVDLGRVAAEAAALVRLSADRRIDLVVQPAPGLPTVEADAAQMKQVMVNLLTNAVEAIGDRPGQVTLRTHRLRGGEDHFRDAALVPPQPAGDFLCIEVSDTGAGIPAADLPRIFDPFFTTKFTGRGLGLAAVHGILRGHRGGIRVYSTSGSGTVVRCYLPLAPRPPAPATPTGPAPPPSSARYVLLIDDQDAVRSVARRALERLGYRVVEARDGAEGLARFRAAAAPWAAVLLDNTMPVRDGLETFQELHRLAPGLRVILMTGFGEAETRTRFAALPVTAILTKPFSPDRLFELLSFHLGPAPAAAAERGDAAPG
jgi:PAS domain S-box-containing protein